MSLQVRRELYVWWQEHGPNFDMVDEAGNTTLLSLLLVHGGDELFTSILSKHMTDLEQEALPIDLACSFEDYIQDLQDEERQAQLITLYDQSTTATSSEGNHSGNIAKVRTEMVQIMLEKQPRIPSKAVAAYVWRYFLDSLLEEGSWSDGVVLQAAADVLKRTIHVVKVRLTRQLSRT